MSLYLEKLCDALVAVFDRCVQLDRRRLAGYVANIDFWMGEVQHRLQLIDGFAARRQQMISGTKAVYDADIRLVDMVRPHSFTKILRVTVELIPVGRNIDSVWLDKVLELLAPASKAA